MLSISVEQVHNTSSLCRSTGNHLVCPELIRATSVIITLLEIRKENGDFKGGVIEKKQTNNLVS